MRSCDLTAYFVFASCGTLRSKKTTPASVVCPDDFLERFQDFLLEHEPLDKTGWCKLYCHSSVLSPLHRDKLITFTTRRVWVDRHWFKFYDIFFSPGRSWESHGCVEDREDLQTIRAARVPSALHLTHTHTHRRTWVFLCVCVCVRVPVTSHCSQAALLPRQPITGRHLTAGRHGNAQWAMWPVCTVSSSPAHAAPLHRATLSLSRLRL